MISTLISFFVAAAALMLATNYRYRAAAAEKRIAEQDGFHHELQEAYRDLIVTSNQQRDEIQALRALPKRKNKPTCKRRSKL